MNGGLLTRYGAKTVEEIHNFDDTWGTAHSHAAQVRLSKGAENALASLQSKPTGRLSGWLADTIANTPAGFNQGCVDTWLARRYAIIEKAQRTWIDAMFVELSGFVREFNNSTAAENMPIVASEPKAKFVLPCKRDASFAPYEFTCYEGHLGTFDWALLVRSYYECIQVFVIPSQMLLALEIDRLSRDVHPLAQWQPAVNDQEVCWTLAGVRVGDEAIPAMAKELFADFLRLALGAVSLNDLFGTTLPSQPAQEKNDSFSSDQAELSAVLRELHIWRAHDLFDKAIAGDLEMLSDNLAKADLKAPVSLVHSQYVELQKSWVALMATIKSMLPNSDQVPAKKSSAAAGPFIPPQLSRSND